jgi:hypothetical protein
MLTVNLLPAITLTLSALLNGSLPALGWNATSVFARPKNDYRLLGLSLAIGTEN